MMRANVESDVLVLDDLFLARRISSFEDSDFTMERFKEAYNADLANGLGNLVARVMKLAEVYLSGEEKITAPIFSEEYKNALEKFEVNKAIAHVFERISNLDKKITETEPFKVIKTDPIKGTKLILDSILELYLIAFLLEPFMPDTSRKIKEAVKLRKKPENLFPRKD